ncbi:MAG: hypothetical protein OXE55_05755 [Flavobacteriaceae bacterium]|nr:hypothetical protein [Flavobacteriaceae bacterium]
MQYFTKSLYTKGNSICIFFNLVHFKNRSRDIGFQEIIANSVKLDQKENAKSSIILFDTTVQDHNIFFLTDTKFNKEAINQCNKITQYENTQKSQTNTKISSIKRLIF